MLIVTGCCSMGIMVLLTVLLQKCLERILVKRQRKNLKELKLFHLDICFISDCYKIHLPLGEVSLWTALRKILKNMESIPIWLHSLKHNKRYKHEFVRK